MHVLTETRAHGVDALTGVAGCESERYLDTHWQHVDWLRVLPVDLATPPGRERGRMSAFRATVLRWANERLDALLGAPPMWGSNAAVEMQAILWMELRALALRPEESDASPDAVFGLYTAFLRQRFPERGPAPLCEIEGAPFQGDPGEFQRLLDRHILAEDPFQHADLVVRLGYKPGASSDRLLSPCSAAATAGTAEPSGLVRGADKKTGRVRKDVEVLTDFSLRDVRLTQPNGAPADAWLLLERGAAAQTDLFALDEVRAALCASTATWLELGRGRDRASRSTTTMRARAAGRPCACSPARRRRARRDRRSPREAHRSPSCSARRIIRCVSILAARAALRLFIESDEIPRIDLDRGTIVLGKRRRLDVLRKAERPPGNRGPRGRRALARAGQLYAPPLSPPFVMAESIDPDEPEARRGG